MVDVCCAAGAITLLSSSTTISLKECMDRCGNTCRGFGEFAVKNSTSYGYWGCEGIMYEPSVHESRCPFNSTMLHKFLGNPHYGKARHHACRGPECAAVYGETLLIKPKNNRPIRVKALPGIGTATVVPLKSIVKFHDNKIPANSQITGPLTLKCTSHSKRLKVGEGTQISNVDVDCPETCPLHVQLKARHKNSMTTLTGVRLENTSKHNCTVIITPRSAVDHPSEFIAKGDVSILENDGYDVAVANTHGTVHIDMLDSPFRQATVTVLETLEDANGRLSLSTSENIRLMNLTAIMDVFSQEYLIGYFGASRKKTIEKHKLAKANWTLGAFLIILVTARSSNDLTTRIFNPKQ